MWRILPILLLIGCATQPTIHDMLAPVVEIRGSIGHASGVIVSVEGNRVRVLSCEHVARSAPDPFVLYRGGGCRAKWIAHDRLNDLALLEFFSQGPVAVATLGTRADCRKDGKVLLVGHPPPGELHWNRGRLIGLTTRGSMPKGLVTNAWIAQGYSGGPMYCEKTGKLLGVISEHAMSRARYTPYATPLRHVAIAVPCWVIREFLGV